MPVSSPPEQGQLVSVRERRFIVTDVARGTLPESPLRPSGNGAQHLVSLPSVEDDTLSFCRRFFACYNEEHYHSGIGLLTPALLHYGQAAEVIQSRQQVLASAYTAHPERFVRGLPAPADAHLDQSAERCFNRPWGAGKRASSDPMSQEARGAFGAPSAWLSLVGLRPRRARLCFSRYANLASNHTGNRKLPMIDTMG